MKFDRAKKIADAVLYEGYLLYPYRASATKNQSRWQFGVVMPRQYSESTGAEPWFMQTECLVEPRDATALHLKLRFLQVQSRSVERAVAGAEDVFLTAAELDTGTQKYLPWDEGIEREIEHADLDLGEICRAERALAFHVAPGRDVELVRDASGRIAGRIVRETGSIAGVIRVSGKPMGSLIKVRIRVENVTEWPDARQLPRAHALRRALAGAHLLLGARDGVFVSLLEPPEWAAAAAASCENLHTWPVLVGAEGERDVMLSSPIILYDYPCIAAESPGDMFDGTEIDEILALRTMTLTDEEKNEARATDPRAAAIIERTESMPAEVFERLHGAVRYLRGSAQKMPAKADVPWWNPEADASVAPGNDSVPINGVHVSKGTVVRLRPGCRSADAQDMFLAGCLANVEAVLFDVEGNSHLAVTLVDDPGADLRREQGRFLYFCPDEIEVVPFDSTRVLTQERQV
jgi:hypothetical protein